MVRKIKWQGEKLRLVKRHFVNIGGMTVLLIDETNFPHLIVSLNSKNFILKEKEIIVKDFGDSKGIKDILISAGYLIPTGRWVEVKNEVCEVCEVI
ncbi:MAG: hypothetical protein ACTSV5_03575 [Promethearchaeota archaeon]